MYDLCIIVTTWLRTQVRMDCLKKTMDALDKNLDCGGLSTVRMLCLEGSGGRPPSRPGWDWCVKGSPPSLSSMLNCANGIASSLGDQVLFLQDDWELKKPLAIEKIWVMLATRPNPAMYRFRWHDGMTGWMEMVETATGIFWKLKPTMNGYYYSDNPHLRTKWVFRATGPFTNSIAPDGTDQGRCENTMNRKCKQLGPDLEIFANPSGDPDDTFKHIGGDGKTTLTQKRFGAGVPGVGI